MQALRQQLAAMVPDLKKASTDLPDEKAVEGWCEEFITRLARTCMKNRVIQYHERLDPQEELKDEVSPLEALQNSVLQFGEVLTAIQQ